MLLLSAQQCFLNAFMYHNSDLSECVIILISGDTLLQEYFGIPRYQCKGELLDHTVLTARSHDASWWLDFTGTLEYHMSIFSSCSLCLKSSFMTNCFISFRSLLRTHFLREAFLDDFIWNFTFSDNAYPCFLSLICLLSTVTVSHIMYLLVYLVYFLNPIWM